MKILIVDDIEANLISLEAILKDVNPNFEVLKAYNGFEVLEIVLEEECDLIILDIQMPEMDGFEVAKLLKENQKTSDIPIIFLTAAFKSEEFRKKGLEIGAFDYLTKPIDEIQLANKISLYARLVSQLKDIKRKDKILADQSKMVALGEMIGNIAHQWRQPLSVISTLATGIIMKKEIGISNEKNEIESLETINKTAQYLSETIDNFRDFIKGDSKKEEFNLLNIINKALDIEESILKSNDIEIILDADEISLISYPSLLMQILINLINNSKDAFLMNNISKKIICISTKKIKDKIQIIISDNAGGIPDNIIDRIFEAYFTTKHKSQGTGLGLYMSYNIITSNMQGSIEVVNEDCKDGNLGAKFIIKLPLEI